MNKNVCMIVHEYYPKDFRVKREAEALVKNGVIVDVICLKKKDEKYIDNYNGVNILRLPVKRHRGSPVLVYILEYFSFFIMSFLYVTIKTLLRKYEFIHIHNPPDFLVFAGSIPKLLNAKIIFDVHDRVPLLYQSRFNKNMKIVKLIQFIEKIAVHFADTIIVAVNIYKNMYQQSGIPSEKINVIINSADESYFKKQKNFLKENSMPQIFFHGTLVNRYGIDILIEALNILRNNGREFNCYIYGSGDSKPQLIKKIKEYELDSKVFLKGFVLIDKIPDLIEKSDLCIVPNKKDIFMDTVLPTKLLEYIVMGKPVIVSRTKEVEQIFQDDELEYVEPGNAEDLARKITKYLDTPKKFNIKIKKAKHRYESLKWDNQIKILMKVYGMSLENDD